jgi:sec-independent protein translocase protein TatC
MASSRARQPFAAHVDELRYRLTWSTATLMLGSALGYYWREHLLSLLSAPLGLPLYYTSPGGGFSLIIQLCLGFGLAVSVPVFIFHLIRFVAPILPRYSTKLLAWVLVCSCALVAAGVLFAYYVSLPAALYFLSEFSNEQVRALISTDTYIGFVSVYLVGFAVLFQLPLLILLINRITPLRPRQLIGQARWVVLLAVVAAALLTPTPDPFNQLIMAGPVLGLYGLSIGMVGVVNRSSKSPAKPASISSLWLDLSDKKLVAKFEAAHQGRVGYLCTWEDIGLAGVGDTIVTFLYKGKHEYVATETRYRAEPEYYRVPDLFVDS